jgi:hypothetical protein
MREWNLKAGDPLQLTLAADARFSSTDYCDDQIWELTLGGGDPPALVLQTTYGLRARSMRLFPRFAEGDRDLTDPAEFIAPPRVSQFFPNYLCVQCTPFELLDVQLEYWVPESQAVAGRVRIQNNGKTARILRLSWIAQLNPTDGQRMAPVELQNAPLLAGQTSSLSPVVFLTGGPQAVSSPFPALNLDIELPPGAYRSFTWCHAALHDVEASFNLARQIAARPWDSAIARLELSNSAQVEVFTGDPSWDVAFALSQKLAYTAFVGPTTHLPAPSIVLSRQPDQGFSLRGDGSDYTHLWNGQSPLEVYYLADILLPGGAPWLRGLIRNYLATRVEDGGLDWKPGLAGQRSRLLAMPILATLAWRIYQAEPDLQFLEEVFQALLAFVRTWFAERHDRDGDGFPEWDHPMQSGFDDHPIFSRWREGSQAVEICTAESPSLGAMLYKECESLICIAAELGRNEAIPGLKSLADHLQTAVEASWDERNHTYLNLDRDSHYSTTGELIGERTGPGDIQVQRGFEHPVRVLAHVHSSEETTRYPEVFIYGKNPSGRRRVEHITNEGFHWFFGNGTLTGERIYTHLERIQIQGIGEADQVVISSAGYNRLDQTLLIPLWARLPDEKRARSLVRKTIRSKRRFWRAYGIPACIGRLKANEDRVCRITHLPWNVLIGEGLLSYGYREEAAELVSQLMSAIISHLKLHSAFSQYYHSETGAGLGERNALTGLAPLGLFLETLGVRIYSAKRVFLSGFNPFPWPVTVKYRGLTILRQKDSTILTFPDGQTTTVSDPSPQVVSLA